MIEIFVFEGGVIHTDEYNTFSPKVKTQDNVYNWYFLTCQTEWSIFKHMTYTTRVLGPLISDKEYIIALVNELEDIVRTVKRNSGDYMINVFSPNDFAPMG